MEKLKELHGQVKEHPYRISGEEKYLKSYKELLHKLSSEFYQALKSSKFRLANNMIHDFNRDIGNIGRDWKLSNESNLHVERCISTIHDFIETGQVLSWWDGVGELFKPVGRYIRYVWNEEKEKYFMDIPKDKIPLLIPNLESHIKMMKEYNKKVSDSIVYNQEILDFWIGTVENLKSKL